MTDKRDGEITDLDLARLVRDLDSDIQPDRDLWVGIERKIVDYPQKVGRDRQIWMPTAVAASLLIAVSALVLNLVQLTRSEDVNAQLAGIDLLQDEYVRARVPMLDEFTRVNHSLDSETKTELYRNLKILAVAREQLEAEVRANPDNARLREMLISLHEQELALLRRDFTNSSRSL